MNHAGKSIFRRSLWGAASTAIMGWLVLLFLPRHDPLASPLYLSIGVASVTVAVFCFRQALRRKRPDSNRPAKPRSPLLSILTALSLLLCVAAGVLWARSSTHVDGLSCRDAARNGGVAATTVPGAIEWTQRRRAGVEPRSTQPGRWEVIVLRQPRVSGLLRLNPERSYLGFGYDACEFSLSLLTPGGGTVRQTLRGVVTPLWAWVIPFALLPARALLTRASRRRRDFASRGLCVRCGYDLRATPGRCPECGTAAHPAGAVE